MLIAGIDLAWGEKNGDGLCLVDYQPAAGRRMAHARVLAHSHVFGDEALLGALQDAAGDGPAFLAFDAPLVCVNATGRRPVDAAVSAAFRAQHAGCYPVNTRLAPRPLRLAARLSGAHGYSLNPAAEGATAARRAAEVFPHPAIVRFLGLSKILEYKRKSGRPRAHSEAEFGRLQGGLGELLTTHFPWLAPALETSALLSAPWSKPVEDQLDALVCAFIALWHVHHVGGRSEIFGDVATGFVLVPAAGSHQL
jgi:predicted RNase H-like nuclease